MAWNPDPAWIALIGTVAGTIGLKVAEHFLGKGRVKIDDASKIRDELRLEITANKTEIQALEAAVDKWRDEYYALRDRHVMLQTQLTILLQNLKQGELSEDQKKALEPPSPPVVD